MHTVGQFFPVLIRDVGWTELRYMVPLHSYSGALEKKSVQHRRGTDMDMPRTLSDCDGDRTK